MRYLVAFVSLLLVFGVAIGWGEQVDNPVFVAWSKCKPGTTVTREDHIVFENLPTTQPGTPLPPEQTTTTERLLEVKPGAITVEDVTPRRVNGVDTVSKRTVTVPAKVDTEHVKLGGPTPFNITDRTVGKEQVEWQGKKYDAVTWEYGAKGPNERSMTFHFKTWYVVDLPGGVFKRVIEQHQWGNSFISRNTSTVVDVKVAEGSVPPAEGGR